MLSLSGDGSTIVAGSPSNNGNVDVHSLQGGEWKLVGQAITPDVVGFSKQSYMIYPFHSAVSKDGNVVAVGSPYVHGPIDEKGDVGGVAALTFTPKTSCFA